MVKTQLATKLINSTYEKTHNTKPRLTSKTQIKLKCDNTQQLNNLTCDNTQISNCDQTLKFQITKV